MASMGQDQATERALLEEYGSLDDKTNAYAIDILFAGVYNYLTPASSSRQSTAHVMLQQASRGRSPFFKAGPPLSGLCLSVNDWIEPGAYFAESSPALPEPFPLRAPQHGRSGLGAPRLEARAPRRGRWWKSSAQLQLEQAGPEEDEARSLRAGLMLDQGDRKARSGWADAFTVPVPDRPLYWAEVPHITRAPPPHLLCKE